MTTLTKKYVPVLLNCLLSAILIACSTDYSRLSQTELLLETNPIAADSLLSTMPQPTSSRNYAWYAVLKTQALYKQYKPITSDSLILIATNYYGTRHKSYRSAMAWYTQGCVYTELNDEISAIDAFLKAKDLFPDTLIRYYALTEQNLAKCYLAKEMYKESKTSFIQCRNIAQLLGDSSIIAYSDYHLAFIQIRNKQYEGVNDSFQALSTSKNLAPFYRQECLIQLAKYHLFYTNKPDSAIYYLNLHLAVKDIGTKGATYNLLANVNYRLGEYDSALHYFNKSLKERNDIYTLCNSYGRLSELSLLKGNNQEAFKYGKLYTEGLDSIRVLTNSNEIAAITIAHKTEIESIKRKEYHNKVIIIGVLILLSVLALLYAYYQSQINKVNRNYIKFCDNVWASINTTFTADSSDYDYLTTGKTKYLNSPSHFILLSNICENNITRNEKEVIKHDLNVAFSDLIAFMTNKYPTINNREVQLCILSFLGLEKNRICQLLDLSNDSFRKQKSRLKEKLGDSYDSYFAKKTPTKNS